MKQIIRNTVTAAVALIFVAGSLTAEAVKPLKGGPSLVDVALDLNTDTNSPYYGEFDILIGAVLAADPVIVATLSARGQRTVFAPVDAAFEALGITEDNVGDLDQEYLTEVLAYHVVNGRRSSKSVLKSKRLRTLQGGYLRQSEGVLTDGLGRKANIIAADVPARNGIIHAIDSVVLPYQAPSLVDLALELNTNINSPYYGEFDILIGAVLAADPAIVATLSAKGQRTVFAPIDAAFEAIGITEDNVAEIDQETLTEVLSNHVVNKRRTASNVLRSKRLRTLQGGNVWQKDGVLKDGLGREANLIAVDLRAKNGIIHAIDSVLLPYQSPNVVDLAIELNSNTNSPYFGEFDILIAAVLAADPSVLEYLTGRGQRTVFAPIDAAFEAIGITEENVGEIDQQTLTEVLSNHVVNKRRNERNVLRSKRLRTLQGGYVWQDSGVLKDGLGRESNIIATDLRAGNGIIHGIDSVLLPYQAPDVVDLAIELNSNPNSPYFGEFDILIAAVLAADPAILEYLTGRGQRTVFAPIDAAFEDLGITEANVGELDQAFLSEVLAYHVLPRGLSSKTVLRSEGFRTVQGEVLLQDSGVLTDALDRMADIIAVDLRSGNGIIHGINAVVLPFAPPE